MRRFLSMVGIVVLLALAMTLLWRVYSHHVQAEPYDDEEPAVVTIGAKITDRAA